MPVSELMGAEATSEMHGKCPVALGVGLFGNNSAARCFYVATLPETHTKLPAKVVSPCALSSRLLTSRSLQSGLFTPRLVLMSISARISL